MALPFDFARCSGTTHSTCATCRRREPGSPDRQSYIAPPIDMLTGTCPNYIGPIKTWTTNNIQGAT